MRMNKILDARMQGMKIIALFGVVMPIARAI